MPIESGLPRGYRLSDQAIFCRNSLAHSRTLKRRYIELTGDPDRCSSCSLGPRWNGDSLVLQLDHRNGVRNDNRLVNLRWLCPNCHSQTPTYCGRNRGSRAA